jgi:hypothetical protein
LGVEKMLRIYFVQQWFNLSDPQAEDALYDSESIRNNHAVVGIRTRVGQDNAERQAALRAETLLLRRRGC